MKKQNNLLKIITKQLLRSCWKFYMLVDMLPVWLGFQSMSWETQDKLERGRKSVYKSSSKHMNRYIEVKCQ